MADLPICPRCGHYVPHDHEPGSSAGVPSLVTDGHASQAWICEPCGWHEAWQQAQGQLSTIDMWPLEVPERFYRGVGSC